MPPIEERLPVAYLGVDPGKSGGLALYYEEPEKGQPQVVAVKMPPNRTALKQWLLIMLQGHEVYCVVEQVSGYHRQSEDGETGGTQPGSAAFKFGQNYGEILGMLEMLDNVQYAEVPPATWHKELGILPRIKGRRRAGRDQAVRLKAEGGESKEDFKRRLKAIAQKMYPSLKVTLNTSDALLLMEYCKRRQS